MISEVPHSRDSEQYFRNVAAEVAFALKSRILLREISDSVVGYAVSIGPRRGLLILWENGGIQLKGSLPAELDQTVVSHLNYPEGRVTFSSMNRNGVPASLEIRSTNPDY